MNKTFEVINLLDSVRCPTLSNDLLRLRNFATDIIERDAGNLWLGTPEGLYSFNKKTKAITVMRPKPRPIANHDVYNTNVIMNDGRYLWLGGWGCGIQRYDTLTKLWNDYRMVQEGEAYSVNNYLQSMCYKSEHEFWVATYDLGLGVFNKKTGVFSFLKNDVNFKNLPPIGAHLIFSDRQNNLYVRYLNKLFAFKSKPNLFFKYEVPGYLHLNSGISYAEQVFNDRTNRYLYAGTSYSDGVIKYDKQSNSFAKMNLNTGNKKFDPDYITQFLKRDSVSQWLLAYNRLYIYYYEENKIEPCPAPDPEKDSVSNCYFNKLAVTTDSIMWFGTTRAGIVRYDMKTNSTGYFGEDESDTAIIGTKYTHCLITDVKNNVWFGTHITPVLGCYNDKWGRSIYFDKNGKTCKRSKSIATGFVSARGNFVFASTSDGLLIFDVSKSKPFLKTIIGTESGFITNYIYQAKCENDSILWLNTAHGLVRYNINSKFYELINEEDGVTAQVMVLMSSESDNIHISCQNLFFEYNPLVKHHHLPPLTPVLTSFIIDGKPVNTVKELVNSKKITVPGRYSYFTISYASLDYSDNTRITYQYQLKGVNKEWIDAGESRNISFSNLDGGNYQLLMRCTKDRGIHYSDVSSYAVFIETVFYRTLWFKVLVAIIASLALVNFYRYRTRQQQAIMELNSRAQLLEKEKALVQYENLVQQLNPHFLFNSLTSLSSLITTDSKTARQFVDQMSKIYRYILKSSENETVPLINEINFATTYVKLQQTRFSDGFVVNINVSEEYHHRKIVPVTVQNLIENTIKHNVIDSESPLVVELYVEEDYLIVKNNIQRKSAVETSNKRGLEQMKSLYKHLSDKPILIDETEKYFTIKIPLI